MTKSDLKESLPTLSHLEYDKVPTDNLEKWMKDVFQDAEHIINSIPPPPSSGSPPSPPPKANTAKTPEDTLASPFPPNDIDERNSKLQSAWGKPVKVAAKDNPLGIAVYKMSGHDGHGAWFARRSVHQNLGFTRWKKNMQREFAESMAQEGGPGAGAVRGIGADRRVEKHDVKGMGKMEVWQLSAQFPGPTTPREFLSIVVSSEHCLGEASALSANGNNPPRHFILISRPTTHSDAPARNGLVLGHYESVEMIREIPLAKEGADPETNPLEWIMVTRSDPGGGIPRFMVERGTPASIVADTSKFLKWALGRPEPSDDDIQAQEKKDEEHAKKAEQQQAEQPAQAATQTQAQSAQANGTQGGIFGTLASYTESAVATVAPSYVPTVKYALGTNTADDEDDYSDSSSGSSGFESAEESLDTRPAMKSAVVSKERSATMSSNSSQVSNSQRSLAADLESGQITPSNHHEKNVVKISRKRTLLDEKLAKAKEEHDRKMKDGQSHDHEKLEKEKHKLEAKHNKEVEKLERKQAKEERKAEEKRQKALSKDELHKTKTERDEYRQRAETAEKNNQSLQKQIEELQKQKTAASANDEYEQRAEVMEKDNQSLRKRLEELQRQSAAPKSHMSQMDGTSTQGSPTGTRITAMQGEPTPSGMNVTAIRGEPVVGDYSGPTGTRITSMQNELPHRYATLPANGAQYFTQEGNA